MLKKTQIYCFPSGASIPAAVIYFPTQGTSQAPVSSLCSKKPSSRQSLQLYLTADGEGRRARMLRSKRRKASGSITGEALQCCPGHGSGIGHPLPWVLQDGPMQGAAGAILCHHRGEMPHPDHRYPLPTCPPGTCPKEVPTDPAGVGGGSE